MGIDDVLVLMLEEEEEKEETGGKGWGGKAESFNESIART